jgi:hypothetical protein
MRRNADLSRVVYVIPFWAVPICLNTGNKQRIVEPIEQTCGSDGMVLTILFGTLIYCCPLKHFNAPTFGI